MADPDIRPSRALSEQADKTTVVYDLRVEIVVKANVLDEKRLQQLIDERVEQLAATLRSRVR